MAIIDWMLKRCAASAGSGRSAVALGVARELAIVGFAAAVYGAVRALTEGSAAQAVENATALETVAEGMAFGNAPDANNPKLRDASIKGVAVAEGYAWITGDRGDDGFVIYRVSIAP